jgi:hypothetical protein
MTHHVRAPTFPAGERGGHIEHILTAQLFFFLRDIGHRHQHHDPNTDTVVDLWKDNPNDPFDWNQSVPFPPILNAHGKGGFLDTRKALCFRREN